MLGLPTRTAAARPECCHHLLVPNGMFHYYEVLYCAVGIKDGRDSERWREKDQERWQDKGEGDNDEYGREKIIIG